MQISISFTSQLESTGRTITSAVAVLSDLVLRGSQVSHRNRKSHSIIAVCIAVKFD